MDLHERYRILCQDIHNARFGDKVYTRAGWNQNQIIVNTITAESKTTFLLDSGVRLSRTTGRRLGEASSYNAQDYHMYTPAAAELLEQERLEGEAKNRLETQLRTLKDRVARLHLSQVTPELLKQLLDELPAATA